MAKPKSRVRPPAWLRSLWRPRIYALTLLFLLTLGVGLAWGSWRNICAACPSVAQIRTWEPEQTSKLLDHRGELIFELGRDRRTPVSIEAMPDHLPQAVLAIEDRRFQEHGGFDPRGFTRAVFGVLTGQNLGGGSTITQQLARNMFTQSVGRERSYSRKLRELQVAFELERSYTKDQILEAYLNQIYLGRGYGVQSASRAYFGENVADIDPAEAALLAAILNSPGNYNPYTRPRAALARRNLVLSLMADQGFMSEEEAGRWQAEPLPTEDHSIGVFHGEAPYFEEWVRQILESRFGEEVYSGGLQVWTTLDLDMQEAAQEAMEWGWDRIESQPNFRRPTYAEFDTAESFPSETPYLQGAFIAVDPRTGHVKAMIGGRDFEQSKFDRARQARRQAGSGFKPFVYTAALASGIPASHIVVDQPVVYPQVDGTEWRPENFDQEFVGPLTIREGLRRSINMVAIKLGWEEVGIETVAQTARKMGIQTEIERFPSTTIGAVEVIPIQMAEAYSAFSTLGTKVRPFPVLRVLNADGAVVWEPQPERTQVLDSLVTRIAVDMLQEAANEGTGANHRDAYGERMLGYDSPVPTAGKTGTTNDGTNTWFNGVTPNLVAIVWFGMDRPQPIARGRPQATGGYYSAPVWGRFMRHVYHGDVPGAEGIGPDEPAGADTTAVLAEAAPPPGDEASDDGATARRGPLPGNILPIPPPWPVPVGLTTREVDSRTGKLWSRWCEGEPYTELYIPGTEPNEVCDDTGTIFRPVPLAPEMTAEGEPDVRIYTFDTTNNAMWAEEVAVQRGIPAEVVPAPSGAKAKCDLALRTFAEHADALEAALSGEEIPFAPYPSGRDGPPRSTR